MLAKYTSMMETSYSVAASRGRQYRYGYVYLLILALIFEAMGNQLPPTVQSVSNPTGLCGWTSAFCTDPEPRYGKVCLQLKHAVAKLILTIYDTRTPC